MRAQTKFDNNGALPEELLTILKPVQQEFKKMQRTPGKEKKVKQQNRGFPNIDVSYVIY